MNGGPTLHWIAIASLLVSAGCFVVVLVDIALGQRQKMWIMDLVWPITMLYSGPLGLWAYFRVGRRGTKAAMASGKAEAPPRWIDVALGSTHCGAGCTLGDLLAEWGLTFFSFTLFGHALYGGWVVDFVLAFLIGIAFQYFTIKPMRDLSPGEGLKAALKADSLSLTSWQVGMYGWMAIATFGIFGHELPKSDPVFWLMMQIAMLCGFATSYPVNWWLLQRGLKETMKLGPAPAAKKVSRFGPGLRVPG